MPTAPENRSRPRAKTAPTDPKQGDAAVRVLRRFRVVFNAVKAHFRQVESEAGIGGAQLWALSLIAEKPQLSVGDLARAMDIHQTTASNLVKSLVTLDLVSASKSTIDRRAVELNALPAGLSLLSKAPSPFSGVLPNALANLDPDVLKRLDRDLAVLIAALESDKRAAHIPLAEM